MNDLAHDLEPIEQEEEKKKEVEQEEVKQESEQEPQQEEVKPEKPPKGFVPQGALHEERARRKELQRMNEELQAAQARQMAVMEQRFAQIQSAMQPRPQIPAFDDDPVSNLKHGVEATQAEIAQIRAWHQQEYERQMAEQRQAAFMRQLESRVADDIREFVETAPDYLDAIMDLRARRAKQHVALGATEQQAMQMVMQEEYQLAAAALQNGRSPAKAAYEIALAYGYTKKEAKEAVENAQKIETLQKGVKAAQSLGSGGTATGKVTVDAIANMSDDDFDAFMKSGGWAKLG